METPFLLRFDERAVLRVRGCAMKPENRARSFCLIADYRHGVFFRYSPIVPMRGVTVLKQNITRRAMSYGGNKEMAPGRMPEAEGKKS
jgi:hypothetical protein